MARTRAHSCANSVPESATIASAKQSRAFSRAKVHVEEVSGRVQDEPATKRVERNRLNPFTTNKTPPRQEGHWPNEESWPEETSETVPTIKRLLARERYSASLSRKRSHSATSTTPSDQQPREQKSAPYRDQRYETLLAIKGSFMVKPTWISPMKIHNKNEARVILDITRLIVPSAESLAIFGAKHLSILTESINEGWNNSIPLTDIRPQPDYSVGFTREAFTDDQLAKLSPFIGDFITGDQSLFMATYYIYFPFLTCEVKCGAIALDIAGRQNAHSMTLAVRGVVELFRAVNRDDKVNRQILAFSVSHDHYSVGIYGYYPVITGEDIKYYRHPIYKFDLTTFNGRDKWIAYRFTKNVYDIWMPLYFKSICSAIDQLPSNLDFDVSPLSEATGLPQDLGNLMHSGAGSTSVPVEGDSQSSNAEQPSATPGTSLTRPEAGSEARPEVAKRRKGQVKK
ncbi:hypothetical protein VP1G_10697 [Cytospora mali]|uniref:DUF7924 domain-containing protein n=1 Tax=Cytospora mali TaxID=578113 RepID=A0A194USM4_CYTMA|nr:hypothetical protein VP1G_10697 [Valsa mali var. pyri (nom. inval.)]